MSARSGAAHRAARPGRTPHPGVWCGATLGALAGLYPTPLPRSGWVAGLLVAGCVAVTTTIALLLTRNRLRRHVSPLAPVCAGLVVSTGAVANLYWQNIIRDELGYPPAGAAWFGTLVGPALVVFAMLVWAPRITVAAVAMTAALGAGYVPATAGNTTAASPRAPASVVYAGLGPGSDSDRADNLVRRWLAAGGRADGAVVVAVPTGSGWVDPTAASALVDRFGGRVRVIALQYAAVSSWRAFVGDREAAGRSTIAVLARLADATRGPQPEASPRVYLYGQSLGALGADRARAWADRYRPGLVAGTLLAGVPADSVDRSVPDTSSRTVIANGSDPVAGWSVASLWRPAQRPADTRVVGRPARPVPWLPVISFVQSTADLLASLGGPTGAGHRYGREQGLLPTPAPTARPPVQPIGPRAAS